MDNFQRLGVAENKVSEQEIAEDVLRFRCLKETKKRIPVSALVYLLPILTAHYKECAAIFLPEKKTKRISVSALVYLLHKATILTVECSDFAACIHE